MSSPEPVKNSALINPVSGAISLASGKDSSIVGFLWPVLCRKQNEIPMEMKRLFKITLIALGAIVFTACKDDGETGLSAEEVANIANGRNTISGTVIAHMKADSTQHTFDYTFKCSTPAWGSSEFFELDDARYVYVYQNFMYDENTDENWNSSETPSSQAVILSFSFNVETMQEYTEANGANNSFYGMWHESFLNYQQTYLVW